MKHLLSVKLIVLLLLAMSTLAHAEGIGPGLQVPATHGVYTSSSFFAYKKGGEQISWNFTKVASVAGGENDYIIRVYSPEGLFSATTLPGTTAVGTVRAGTTSSTVEGIWIIQLIESGPTALNYDNLSVDINVKTSATGSNIPGRVYTNTMAFQNAVTPAMNTFSIYSVNQQGYKYTSTFYGLLPVNIDFYINPYGNVLKGTCTSAYKSYTVEDPNFPGVPTDPRYEPGKSCGGASKIFFNPIAEDVPAIAPIFSIATSTTIADWINPAVAVESVSGLTFNPNLTPTTGAAGSFTFNVANYIGNSTLKIDVNNNGVYTDAVDRSIVTGVIEGSNTVAFDGKDGAGSDIPCETTMKAQLVLDKPGEIHFVLVDAEGLGGIKITRTTGASPSSVISWDDSQVSSVGKSSQTPVKVGMDVNSSFNQTTHGWTWPTVGSNSWGNASFIDNWAFLPGGVNEEITFIPPCPKPDLTPIISLPSNNFASNTTTKNFTVGLYELLSVPTGEHVIQFQVTVPTGYSLTFVPTLTDITPTGGANVAVKNSDWEVIGIALAGRKLTFQAKAGISIAAISNSVVGFSMQRVSAQPGSTSAITTGIINDSSLRVYDSFDENNIYSRNINAL